MMIKIFLISACVAASANADWDWNGNNPSGSRIRRMQADSYSQFANIDMPVIPDMPNFDFEDIKFPKIEIPKMPEIKIPDMKISPENMASLKGSGYQMSMVTMNGETVVTINANGNIETFKVPAGSSKEKTSAILAGTVVNN